MKVVPSSLKVVNHVSIICTTWKSSWLSKQGIKACFLGQVHFLFLSLEVRVLCERKCYLVLCKVWCKAL